MEVVNNQAPVPQESADSAGSVAGIVILLLVVVLLFVYGVPALQGMARSASPSVNVPGKIDVNINGPQNGSPQGAPNTGGGTGQPSK